APPTANSTLPLHDALPISNCHEHEESVRDRIDDRTPARGGIGPSCEPSVEEVRGAGETDQNDATSASRRNEEDRQQHSGERQDRSEEHTLNSSHLGISYAV